MESLKRMEEIHIKKNEDYADNSNPFSNFDVSEYGLRLFTNPRDQAFIWPIFTKLARIANLLSSNHTPNNESIDDSFIDIANYILLWKADYVRRICEDAAEKIAKDPKALKEIFNNNPYKEASEEACKSIIEASKFLSDIHLEDMKEYLKALQEHRNITESPSHISESQ